jgi:hypothetical protein
MTAAQDHPEPVEPTMATVPDGIFCLAHGVLDCGEPWCWRCGNHQMDDFDRCADPRCRATCSPQAMELVEDLKARWRGPVPLEVITVAIGDRLAPPSFLPESEAGQEEQPTRLVPGAP